MAVISYTKCPACGENAEIDDGLIEEKITHQEEKQRIATKKMIRKIIPAGVNYRVIFLQKASKIEDADLICKHCKYYEMNWGWTHKRVYKHKGKLKSRYDIYIPRKTSFLPRDEFIDTVVAHEPTHALVWEDRHGQEWYFLYRDNRKFAFHKFSKFINAKDILPVRFRKDYKIYPSDYEHEYEEEQKRLSLFKVKE